MVAYAPTTHQAALDSTVSDIYTNHKNTHNSIPGPDRVTYDLLKLITVTALSQGICNEIARCVAGKHPRKLEEPPHGIDTETGQDITKVNAWRLKCFQTQKEK